MRHVRVSDHIAAPLDHVWDINASCERLPEWNVNIVDVKDCQGRLDRVGARVTTVVRVFGRKIEGSQETTKADKPHAFALKLVGAGGAKGIVDGTFTETRGGTDATLELEYDLPMGMFAGVAEKLLGGSIGRDLRHSMENASGLRWILRSRYGARQWHYFRCDRPRGLGVHGNTLRRREGTRPNPHRAPAPVSISSRWTKRRTARQPSSVARCLVGLLIPGAYRILSQELVRR